MARGSRDGLVRWLTTVNVPLMAAAVATVLCALFYLAHRTGIQRLAWLDRMELDSVDVRHKVRGTRAPVDNRIVIVGLDDATRERTPELFQQRAGWARLIDAIAKQQPRAIGIDAFYAAPEINLPRAAVTQVRAAADVLRAVPEPTPAETTALAALDAVLETLRGDEILAEAIARAKVVELALMFNFELGNGGPAPAGEEPAALAGARFDDFAVVSRPRSLRPIEAAPGFFRSLPNIVAGARGAGFVNVAPDTDGVLRRVPTVVDYGGRYYASLGLAMARRAQDGGDLVYVTGERTMQLGSHTLQVDARGRAHVSYLGPEDDSFPTYSAADVVEDKLPPDALTDKLVFVGYTDTANDKVATPIDPLMSGVYVHATLAHNALHGELLTQTPAATTIIVILVLGALLTAIQLRRVRQNRAWLVGLAALVVIAIYGSVAQYLFSHQGVIIEVVPPVLSCMLVSLASMTAGLATEGREKARLHMALSQYVERRIADRIVADPSQLELGGERREMTVLFSDIRGFSRFSEGLDPQALRELMTEYLTPMTELVMSSQGMLDKYIGDAIMAIYGAPLPLTDHAARACDTALRMFERLDALNDDFVAKGRPPIAIGVGINTGAMSVGNMGSVMRFDYTVLGDAVNLGARLEALTKEYKTRILVGKDTADAAGDGFVFRELDRVRVTGRDEPASICELVSRAGESPYSDEDLAVFDRGVAAYVDGQWDDAAEAFGEFAKHHPNDGTTQVFAARVDDLRASPPDAWDGVYDQRSK